MNKEYGLRLLEYIIPTVHTLLINSTKYQKYWIVTNFMIIALNRYKLFVTILVDIGVAIDISII